MKTLKNIIISLLCGFAVFLICASLSVFAPLRASDPIGSGLALLLYFLMDAIVGVMTGAGVFIMLFFKVVISTTTPTTY